MTMKKKNRMTLIAKKLITSCFGDKKLFQIREQLLTQPSPRIERLDDNMESAWFISAFDLTASIMRITRLSGVAQR